MESSEQPGWEESVSERHSTDVQDGREQNSHRVGWLLPQRSRHVADAYAQHLARVAPDETANDADERIGSSTIEGKGRCVTERHGNRWKREGGRAGGDQAHPEEAKR